MQERTLASIGTYSDVLTALRMALMSPNASFEQDVDWAELYEEMRRQAVHSMVGDVLMQFHMDTALKRRWKMSVIHVVQHNVLILAAQSEAIQLLEQSGISVVVLKGSAAAMYYHRPEYRVSGDVDLLVSSSNYEKSVALLLKSGYALAHEREYLERHAALVKSGVTFEVHRRFATLSDADKAAHLENTVFEAIDRAEKHQQEGMKFNTLPPLENGLVLLQHLSQHMEEGIGLRQILDWMMYVDSVLDDELWQHSFMKIAKQTGLEMLAIVVTRMCQIYLGLTEEGRHWCLCADSLLCDALLVDVFDNGNFGKKREQFDSGIIKVSSRSYNPFSILAHMQRVGLANWRRAQENILYRPFAWVYQMGVYARQLLSKRMTISDVRRDLRRGRERAQLLEALGVFRLRDGVAVRTENGYTKKKY